jgi:mannonate dehydratase
LVAAPNRAEPVRHNGRVNIADVRTIRTAPEGIRLVVVKVETDEPGLYGVGCATFTQRPLAVIQAVEEYLKPLLVGRDACAIEDVYQSGYLSSYWRQGPVLNNALSGVDMALWDIKGKLAGMPVYQLFGGKCRRAAALYAHASGHCFEEVEEEAQGFIEDGYRHVRCQVAVADSAAYGVSSSVGDREPGIWEPAAYRRMVPRLFDHLRETLGDEVELLHDVHERLPPIDAIGLAKDLERHQLFFLEDPVAPEDAGYLRLLRRQSATPIALGELFVNQAPEGQGLAGDREVDLSGVGRFVGTMVSCDMVVYLFAITAPNRHPDERVFRDNVLSAFTVLQAAMLRG